MAAQAGSEPIPGDGLGKRLTVVISTVQVPTNQSSPGSAGAGPGKTWAPQGEAAKRKEGEESPCPPGTVWGLQPRGFNKTLGIMVDHPSRTRNVSHTVSELEPLGLGGLVILSSQRKKKTLREMTKLQVTEPVSSSRHDHLSLTRLPAGPGVA